MEGNGIGGDGNQGIGGYVGGGEQREGIGNERRPVDPRRDRMAEILLSLNGQIITALEAVDVTRLSERARILRVVSLGFNSGALVCFLASIQLRGTDARLASILSGIGSVATVMGFISLISMAFLASFIT